MYLTIIKLLLVLYVTTSCVMIGLKKNNYSSVQLYWYSFFSLNMVFFLIKKNSFDNVVLFDLGITMICLIIVYMYFYLTKKTVYILYNINEESYSRMSVFLSDWEKNLGNDLISISLEYKTKTVTFKNVKRDNMKYILKNFNEIIKEKGKFKLINIMWMSVVIVLGIFWIAIEF